MRFPLLKFAVVLAVVGATSWSPAAQRPAPAEAALALQSIGPLTFGPNGVLFAADTQGASIYAFELGTQTAAPGVKDMDAVDKKVAALLGTDVKEITVTDLAVQPQTRNAFLSVMRGQGDNAKPVLLRVDGTGKMEVVSLDKVKFSKVAIPNAPGLGNRNARTQSVTDMKFSDGRLYIAGVSNEEFASKLRSVPYPFATADNGTSVEIYHGNHRQLETRSPVYAFVPYTVNGEPSLIAGYLCTPLVEFPVSDLTPGKKVRGKTIAELGAGNRPLDMIVYKKDGKEYLLMSNNARGVMKIPTAGFGSAKPITAPVESETAGIPYETITSMKNIEQLAKLDEQHSLVLARGNGGLNMQALPLP